MYPQSHFLFSYLVGLVFAKFGIIDYQGALFVALVGMFVDTDHFIVHLLKFKDFNFKHAFNRAVKGVYAGRSFIHHEFGFLAISLILVGVYFLNIYWFWIFAIGYYTHLFLDYAHLNVLKIKEKMVIRKFGIIERINKFELLLDIFLVIGIVLLLL